MSERLKDAIEDALMRAGLSHLEVRAEPEGLSVAPRADDWRQYQVIGVESHPDLIHRLQELDERLKPRIIAGSGGWTVSADDRSRHFAAADIPALIQYLMQEHLLPDLVKPVLAIRIEETEDGHSIETVQLTELHEEQET